MYFRVTSSLPQFKVIYGGYDYDCLAKQPIPFEEVFKD